MYFNKDNSASFRPAAYRSFTGWPQSACSQTAPPTTRRHLSNSGWTAKKHLRKAWPIYAKPTRRNTDLNRLVKSTLGRYLQKFTMKYIIQRSSIYCIERRVGGRLTSVESVLARHVLLPAFRHPIILAMNRHINQKYCIIQVLYHLTPAKRHRCRLFVQSRGRRVYASDKIMVGDDPTSGVAARAGRLFGRHVGV